jgi:hypothetical protein
VPLRKIAASDIDPLPNDPAAKPNGFWRTSLLLISSVALGGIAVALWHRRTLIQFRQEPGRDPDPVGSREDAINPGEDS